MSATLTVTIVSAIAAAVRVVGQVLGLRTRPSAKQLTEKAAHDARAASAQGDATDINARIERHRIRRHLPLITACVILGAASILAGCGCSLLRPATPPPPADLPPAVVVISADRFQYPMTNAAGVAGWFVPLAVHAEMMEAITLLDYYRTLHTPNKGSK